MPFNLLILVRISFVFLVVLLLAMPSYGQIGTCEEARAKATLEVGNIRASIYNDGAFFWKGGQNVYEAPKGEGVNAMFASSLIIGGLIDGSLRMASTTYGPYEFWPGPIDQEGNPPTDCNAYDQIWEITTEDFVLLHQQGVHSANMTNWPWHLGAPVVDGDGIPDNYNLDGGDRPELFGDQRLWWIMNDRGNEHGWSETQPIGLEVHASAFAFEHNRSGGDITFYSFRLINKNSEALTDAYTALFLDPDLGNASDDYIGSDSLLHLGYTYNGDSFDENGYENTPPAIGYTFLVTPEAQIDELDNDHDGQIDEPGETTGLHVAAYFSGGGIQGDPYTAQGMYNYLKGFWLNGEPITVGGTGYNFSNQVTRYIYSGDPVSGSYWTELNPSPFDSPPIPPSDRNMLLSSGPFTLQSGESTDILIALAWAKGQNNLDSVRKLKGIVGNLQSSPTSYTISGYQPELIERDPPPPEFALGFDQNFPNPFTTTTTLRYSLPKTMQIRLAVYDLLGREIDVLAKGTQDAGIYSLEFDSSQLPPGMYYARIELDHLQFTRKLIRVP